MSECEPSVNFNIKGNVNQAAAKIENLESHVGDVHNHAASNQSFEEFIKALQEKIPAQEVEAAQAEILEPLREIAQQPEPENEQDRLTLKARIIEIAERLAPYTPYIRKTIAAFAEGAIMTLPPPASWVVAGCLEVVRDARNRD